MHRYDTVLTCDIFGVHWYKLRDVDQSGARWQECIMRSKVTAAESGGRAAVDLGFPSSLKAHVSDV